MGEEFSSDVSNLLMFHVVLNCVIEVDGVDLAEFHEVDADAVVGQGLSVYVTDGAADLQEFLILRYCVFEFTQVVIEYTCTVIGSALIPGLAGPFAGKCQYFIIF